MGAVTYPDAKVTDFINRHLIPVQVLWNAQPWARDYNLQWTPTLIILDPGGKEHHRTMGFLPPQELIPSLLLGLGKLHFEKEEFKEALGHLDRLIAEYPQSGSAPEAIYLRGVSRYKSTKEPKYLKQAYRELKTEHPASEWTIRAAPYDLLAA